MCSSGRALPGWLTALATAKWISAMVFGAHGGLLADRCDRRTVLTVSALAPGAVTMGMAVMVGVDGRCGCCWSPPPRSERSTRPVNPVSGALIPRWSGIDLIAANPIFALLEGMIVVVARRSADSYSDRRSGVGVLINTAGSSSRQFCT